MYLQLFGARHIEQKAELQLKRKVEGEPFVLKRGPGAKLKKRVSNLLHRLVACDLANLFLLWSKQRLNTNTKKKVRHHYLHGLLFDAQDLLSFSCYSSQRGLTKVWASALPTEEVGVETCCWASHFFPASRFVLKRRPGAKPKERVSNLSYDLSLVTLLIFSCHDRSRA